MILYEVWCKSTGFNVFVYDNGYTHARHIPREGETLKFFRSNCSPEAAAFEVVEVEWPMMYAGIHAEFEKCGDGTGEDIKNPPYPVLIIVPKNDRARHIFDEDKK